MKLNKRQIGSQKETLAAGYLAQNGYEILERNYRTPRGEIDIIAQKDGYLVYVEVRYRSGDKYGDPLESVDGRKQRQICKTAAWHYAEYGAAEGRPCRFDVIGIYADGRIRHVINAFEFQM